MQNQSYYNAQVKAQLNRAADIIEQTGWTQGSYAKDKAGMFVGPCTPEATCFCALGAIRRADFVLGTSNRVGITRACEAVVCTLRAEGYEATPCASSLIVQYNDAPDRTKEEVAALLRRSVEHVL